MDPLSLVRNFFVTESPEKVHIGADRVRNPERVAEQQSRSLK